MGNDIKSPERPEQHIIGDRAVRVFEYRCSKRWVTDPSIKDYGWDILVTIEKEGKVKEDFLAQLKGSDNPAYTHNDKIISVELAVKTIMWLLNKSVPSMISICDTGKSDEPVYYVWLQEDINRIQSTNPKWHEQKNVVVHIPVYQLLDDSSHDGIENYVIKYYEDLKIKSAIGDLIGPSIGIEKSESLSVFVNEQIKVASEKLSPLLKEAGLAEVTEKDYEIEIEMFSKEDKNRFKQIKKSSALLDEFRDDDAKVLLDKLEKDIENASAGIKARYYNNKGVLELHLRKFRNALDYFKKANKLMPDHPKYITNYLLAEYFIISPDDVYEKINFSKEWVDKLEDVLIKNKDFPHAIRLKGLLLSNTEGADVAEKYIKTTKIWHDENVTVRCELAENYKDEGDWDKAIELLSEVEDSEDDLYGPFWSQYGSILMYKAFGKKLRESKFIIYGPGPSQLDLVYLRKAEQCLLKACNKFSLAGFPLMSTTAVANLAMAQRILGRTDEAKHYCKAFLEKHPNNPEVASAMSGCFLASDEITSAAKYARIAYQADPHYKMTYQNYLICLSVLEDSEAVLELVSERLSHGFSNVREEAISLSCEAIAFNEIGRQDDAIKQIRKMKDNPNMIEDATVAEAVIARNNQMSKKEVADIYKEGLKKNPDSLILQTHFIHLLDESNPEDAKELDEYIRKIAQYRQLLPNEIYDLGFSNLTLNKINEGLRIFIEGAKRYSDESRFLYGQAVAHSKLGDEEKAYEALKNYVELGKKNYNILRNLAFLATETGRLDEAISIFQKALRRADDEKEREELNAQLWELRRKRGDPPKEILRHVLEFGKTIKDDPAQEARLLMMVFLSPVPKDEDEEITGWFADFRKRLERFSENHPNFPQFRTFKIPKDLPDKEKGSHILAQIAEVMLPQQLAATPFIISSRTRPYPLSFRAELMPGFSSIFDFWSNCVSSKDFTNGMHIWFDFNPRDVEFNCLSNRNEVCVDITTLLSLAELDLLDLLTKSFNIFY
ncbi:MAG: DUF4365 domain-containing protein [Desulfobacterales bacterium]|nr:DUF4365 domain-containing protein [Desulfobacterales bacterium]